MKKHKKNSLSKSIITDFICSNKFSLILLFISLVSALYVIDITYKTRKLNKEIDKLITRNKKTLSEWSNLVVEYNQIKQEYAESHKILVKKRYISLDS
ncbi:cell division protein FtsL [Candidatus Tachikawaea gelatinosa]|uniref:Cell division protein FtsL n=1 Tax=Candidatus Tachikawaea gelatinosa TaxID=1410383 RepID=A0A090BWE5_9ENTR|nr:cell division protein FtsL [Candidatus Tachikawaea gelatinosa]BAP58466.1 cell division protein FtsL [Candidatus Tachikawaea gelatinosa]